MNRIFFTLLLLIPLAAPAATFKCVDDQGKTEYSDKPCPGGEEVKLPALSTFDAPEVPQRQRAEGDDADEAATANYSVRITSPEHEASFFSNDGSVNVSISVEPQLRSGDQLMLYVGGTLSPDSPLAGTSSALTGLDRGTHALRATVVDQDGKQLASSSTIQFHLSQQTARPRHSTRN